jgi:hypothetical protein
MSDSTLKIDPRDGSLTFDAPTRRYWTPRAVTGATGSTSKPRISRITPICQRTV